jgi:hypothetical protein
VFLQAKAASAAADKVQEEVAQLKRLKGRLAEMEAAAARASLPLTSGGQVDFSQDFFGEKVFLTVSGQLNGEAASDLWLLDYKQPRPADIARTFGGRRSSSQSLAS